MAHVVGDLTKVQRFGRWTSDAFHGYLWDAHEGMLGIAGQMAGDESELTRPRHAKAGRTDGGEAGQDRARPHASVQLCQHA